ncbi:cytochrome b-245 light chain-like [Physella acuta]|uniref:cytochrome b-245 light chain-like n=1 Tax=Physella acuta TaxID=109671 RepID=UPI0027DE6EF9|nr:cytochrome b-245 light chain-like [Physella acuta]
MGKIEWAMWANEHALASSFVMALDGILAVAGQFKLWEIGAYAIAAGIFTFILEYPRGKRSHGTSHPRRFQYPFALIVRQGRLLTRNYFVRFVFYLAIAVPCCFMLPTLLGALCYMLTSFIYLVAGIKGEEWLLIEPEKKSEGPKIIEAPTRPPPRTPDISHRQAVLTVGSQNRV